METASQHKPGVTAETETGPGRARTALVTTAQHPKPAELAVRAHRTAASPAVSGSQREQTGGGEEERDERKEERTGGGCRAGRWRRWRASCLLSGVIKTFSLCLFIGILLWSVSTGVHHSPYLFRKGIVSIVHDGARCCDHISLLASVLSRRKKHTVTDSAVLLITSHGFKADKHPVYRMGHYPFVSYLFLLYFLFVKEEVNKFFWL